MTDSASAPPANPAATRPTIVLLHGLLRSERSVAKLAGRLQAAGYPTWTITYPSRSLGLTALADWLAERIQTELPGQPLFAVTHSLGGILLRLLAGRLPWVGAVLVAPPNTGSRAARRFAGLGLFRAIYGQAGVEVARGEGGMLQLPSPPEPFGVIAGIRRIALGNPTSWLTHPLGLLGRGLPHDGTVAQDETIHRAMADFATVDASHTWILHHPETARLVLRFLQTGGFGNPQP